MAEILSPIAINIVLVNATTIEYGGDASLNGDIHVTPGKSVRFNCTRPFALFIKGYVSAAAAASEPTPFDGDGLVFASNLDTVQNIHEMKVKVKGSVHKGDQYVYGVAVLNAASTIQLDDPRILID